MSRDIKFRAWDEKLSIMIYPEFILGFGFKGIFLPTEKHLGHRVNEDINHFMDNLKVMQYTGIKDKNGKMIFEGDVVKNGLSGTWIIQPLESGSMSLLGICEKYKDRHFDISSLNYNVEVIGNIYEQHKEKE